jgi:hypothetical protein
MRVDAILMTWLGALLVAGCASHGGEAVEGEEMQPVPAQSTALERQDCDGVFGVTRWSGARNSFGFCVGRCVHDLHFGFDKGCRSLELTVSGWGEGGTALRLATNTGKLTSAGVERIRGVSESLRQSELLGVYGCPDCTDGGASRVRVQTGAIESTISYPFGGPPPELLDADALAQSLIAALSSCNGTDLVTIAGACTPDN